MAATERSKKIMWCSLVLYCISMLLPAFVVSDLGGEKTFKGSEVLLSGSIMILGGGSSEWLVWLANPMFLIAVLFGLKQDKRAVVFSLLATVLALAFSRFEEVLVSENGRTAPIGHVGIGYGLWTISFIALLVSGLQAEAAKKANANPGDGAQQGLKH
jgi:hypothetical protein